MVYLFKSRYKYTQKIQVWKFYLLIFIVFGLCGLHHHAAVGEGAIIFIFLAASGQNGNIACRFFGGGIGLVYSSARMWTIHEVETPSFHVEGVATGVERLGFYEDYGGVCKARAGIVEVAHKGPCVQWNVGHLYTQHALNHDVAIVIDFGVGHEDAERI